MNAFLHGCASPNGCGDPACRLCTVIAKLPAQPEKCGRHVTGTGSDCELVAGHPSWVKCRSSRDRKADENATRDGDPKLAGERKRGDLAFRKRHREGPNYVPRNARV